MANKEQARERLHEALNRFMRAPSHSTQEAKALEKAMDCRIALDRIDFAKGDEEIPD